MPKPNFVYFLILASLSGYVEAHWKTLNIVNKCATPIWPGLAPNAGHPVPAGGGFMVGSGQVARVVVPWTWQGRIWGRTGCNFSATGMGTCMTGDCDGKLHCSGSIGKPPASLVQFTFQPDGKPAYYDVSLVDGFNVAVAVKGGGCSTAGCGADVNRVCPSELQVRSDGGSGSVVACKSACLAFDLDRFCCRNEFSSSATCSPSVYSRMFKDACPAAYSYAFDSPPPLFTCTSDAFTLTFCPPKKSMQLPSLSVASL
ncbi:hypothetical protein SUGI_0917870 [Cryptomeria japonica]|uniref:pathogenesis-related thaumatin-like protein 3.5 n=1 Tax=Cryptomeria japonica TaxID=3369 RepID=UPI002414CCED|nr:pathogenesis-related thaumatin-like protein 3.5 [Cryptomeria japonica]GLJ44022.1 hypothetical protein SUGI_0917870 [Cryptomeria japonica]